MCPWSHMLMTLVLLGTAESVTQAITETQAETATGSLRLQKAKTQVWPPTQKAIDDEPLLRILQGRMGDKRGILVLGEMVSEEPENAIPIGNEAFVADHINSFKQKLLDDLCKLEHLPHKLVKGEAGLQPAWGFLRHHPSPSRKSCPQKNSKISGISFSGRVYAGSTLATANRETYLCRPTWTCQVGTQGLASTKNKWLPTTA